MNYGQIIALLEAILDFASHFMDGWKRVSCNSSYLFRNRQDMHNPTHFMEVDILIHQVCYVSTWVTNHENQGSFVLILTHWDGDEMDNISQTTFSNIFSSMKMLEFRLKFHWSLFLGFNQQYSSIGLDNGLALSRQQALIWISDG